MNGPLAAKVLAPLLAGVVLVGAVVVTRSSSPTEVATVVGEGSWIDAPLSGTEVVGGSVEVVAHATHTAGVDAIELSVSGRKVDEIDTGGATLERVTFAWVPEESGIVVLTVRGRAGDDWTPSASTTVTVVDVDRPDASPTTGTSEPTDTTIEPTTTSSTSTSSTTSTTIVVGAPTSTVTAPPPGATTTTRPRATTTTGPTDTTGPEIQDESVVYTLDFATLLVSASAQDPSGVARMEIWFTPTVGGQLSEVKTCNSPSCEWTRTGLTVGSTVQYRVVAVDGVGNQSSTPLRNVLLLD